MQNRTKLLFIGDVCGIGGRAMLQKHLPALKEKYKATGIIVNGENSAGDGRGITSRIMRFFKHIGADLVTSGNHIWAKKDIFNYLTANTDLLRPANFPSGCPGPGLSTFMAGEILVGVLNLQARVFMREQVSCPFRAADSALTFLRTKTNIILVDFHGETTSEKAALANYLDGRVSAVVGTHTHVQTADERILPNGTAFITDVGMVGPLDSVIGVKKELIIEQILTQMPVRFQMQNEGPMVLSGVCIEIDNDTGKALMIERIRCIDDHLNIQEQEE